MGISTKNVRKSFVSKELKPGNVVAKIDRLELTKSDKPKDPKVPEWNLVLHIEGKPMGDDFEGFDKVYGDPSKGKYKGQSLKLKATQYPIRTFSWTDKKDGSTKTKEDTDQILDFIQKLCDTAESKWLDEVDGKFDTLPQLIAGFNKDKVVKDIYMSWLIAADQKVNSKGYDVFYCFLPDYRTAKTVVAKEGGLVTEFDQSVHIIKDKNAVQQSESLTSGTDEELEDELLDDNDEDLFEMDDDAEEVF